MFWDSYTTDKKQPTLHVPMRCIRFQTSHQIANAQSFWTVQGIKKPKPTFKGPWEVPSHYTNCSKGVKMAKNRLFDTSPGKIKISGKNRISFHSSTLTPIHNTNRSNSGSWSNDHPHGSPPRGEKWPKKGWLWISFKNNEKIMKKIILTYSKY